MWKNNFCWEWDNDSWLTYTKYIIWYTYTYFWKCNVTASQHNITSDSRSCSPYLCSDTTKFSNIMKNITFRLSYEFPAKYNFYLFFFIRLKALILTVELWNVQHRRILVHRVKFRWNDLVNAALLANAHEVNASTPTNVLYIFIVYKLKIKIENHAKFFRFSSFSEHYWVAHSN